MKTFLYLDDIRNPQDSFQYTLNKIYINNEWIVVRNYDEFTKHIQIYGLPDVVSFDHDIALEHYTPEYLWNDYEKSKQYQESQNYTEKTGYDCAKYLIDYCIDNSEKLPEYLCHSMNPVGKDNIIGILNNFKNKYK